MAVNNQILEKQKKRFSDKVKRSAEDVLSTVKSRTSDPGLLDFFIKTHRDVFIQGDIGYLKEGKEGSPVFGLYCMMVPEELIYAAGALPVRLSGGTYEGSDAGEQSVPRDTCPVVKSAVGSSILEYPEIYSACDVIVTATTCDSVRKMGEELSKLKEVWMMELPHSKETEASRRLWQEQVFAFKNRIEKYTGNKITRKKLRDASMLIASVQFEARRLYEIRKAVPSVLHGSEAALVMDAYAYTAADRWTDETERLNNELEKRVSGGDCVVSENEPRLFLAGSPSVFPNLKLFNIIEEMGGVVALDESCQGDRYIYDPACFMERSINDMITAMASRYMMPCVCPCFTPNDDRLYRLLQIAEDFKIDGIIYHVLKGCIIYDFELSRVARLMEEKNIPVLRVESDYNPEDVEQLRTRIEAFLEMLRKRKNGAKQ